MPESPRNFEKIVDSAYEQISSMKEAIASHPDKGKGKETLLRMLEELSNELDSSFRAKKEYTAKPESSCSHKELRELLQRLGKIPQNSITWKNLVAVNAAQLALFWQVMYGLLARLDAFERETVQPKRYKKVEKVTNERLDNLR